MPRTWGSGDYDHDEDDHNEDNHDVDYHDEDDYDVDDHNDHDEDDHDEDDHDEDDHDENDHDEDDHDEDDHDKVDHDDDDHNDHDEDGRRVENTIYDHFRTKPFFDNTKNDKLCPRRLEGSSRTRSLMIMMRMAKRLMIMRMARRMIWSTRSTTMFHAAASLVNTPRKVGQSNKKRVFLMEFFFLFHNQIYIQHFVTKFGGKVFLKGL